MQPEQAGSLPDPEWARGMAMERVMLAVRQRWFGGRTISIGRATMVVEPGGELLMLVDGPPDDVDRLIETAAARGAHVIATSFGRPRDLAARLRGAGYQSILSQSTYHYEPTGLPSPPGPERRRWGLLSLLHRGERSAITVRQIGPDEVAAWSRVCWRAFGRRGTEGESLAEKQQAYQAMAGQARWYLATIEGRPVGTAILYQGEGAAQVLAVGTDPSYWGRGVATAVMARLIRDWQEEGSGFLFLDATPGTPAERLYLKLGFRLAYRRDLYGPLSP